MLFVAAVHFPGEVFADVGDERRANKLACFRISSNFSEFFHVVHARRDDLPRSLALEPHATGDIFSILTVWVHLCVDRLDISDDFMSDEPSLIGVADLAAEVLQKPGVLLAFIAE